MGLVENRGQSPGRGARMRWHCAQVENGAALLALIDRVASERASLAPSDAADLSRTVLFAPRPGGITLVFSESARSLLPCLQTLVAEPCDASSLGAVLPAIRPDDA